MFGACTKNVCLLTTYCILLSILIIAQIAAGIYAIIEKPKVKRHVTTALKDLVGQYGHDRHLDKVLDEIQDKLQCCGAESPADYSRGPPPSCKNYNEGCIGKVTDLTKKHLNATIVTVFIFALLQMICLVFAVCVLMAIKRGDDE
nr:unknown [Schistosoma japonicum]